jgi:hypothetical protein
VSHCAGRGDWPPHLRPLEWATSRAVAVALIVPALAAIGSSLSN